MRTERKRAFIWEGDKNDSGSAGGGGGGAKRKGKVESFGYLVGDLRIEDVTS